jgi:hypothetical protein
VAVSDFATAVAEVVPLIPLMSFPLRHWWRVPLFWACLAVGHAEPSPRTWTSAEGTNVLATLVDADHATVRLRLATGAVSTVARDRLSAADQTYVAEWLQRQPSRRPLPDLVGVQTPDLKVEVLLEDEAKGRFVYRTANFEFESQGRLAGSLAREVGRSFEATYELLRVLPWHIQPRPAEGMHFRASLFKDMESYAQAGGLPGSAGSYFTQRRRFLVPFESLGIREVGSAYRMDADFDTHVLVHELTHQMMHFWLGYLPQWVVEGMAEYTGNLPLKNGRFRLSEAKNGLKEYLDFRKRRMPGGVPEPYPLDKLFAISSEEWTRIMATDNNRTQRLYLTSYLMIYYFMHLDGQGDGARFSRYMRASAEPVRRVEAHEKALAEFKRRPDVKTNPDGSFVYPRDVQPPALPRDLFFGASREQLLKQNLQVLLDGRTEAELMEQVRAAYRAHQIKM